MAYIAAARVTRIDTDPEEWAHYYARVDNFLEFDRPVPYRDKSGRFEERFLREMPRTADAGRTLRGESVRLLDNEDFIAIVAAGLADTLDPNNRFRLGLDSGDLDPDTQQLMAPEFAERKIEQLLINRKIRDANFRRHVLAAYGDTCAITGLRIVNGGGRVEAQAAHIWSVCDGGPDTVQNGIALSATAHWLFDRHLISLDDEFQVLVAHNKVPSELRALFPQAGQQIRLPADPYSWPRADFVARHREKFGGGQSL